MKNKQLALRKAITFDQSGLGECGDNDGVLTPQGWIGISLALLWMLIVSI